jgi:poly(A) polymerase
MLKLLAAPDPARALEAMIESGVMAALLPQITGPSNLAALCRNDDGDALRRLALLLGRGDAKAVAMRLRLSNDQRDRLEAMTAPPLDIGAALDGAAQRRALYLIGAALFIDLAYLAWAGTGDPGFDVMVETARKWRPPALPIDGNDVIALGVERGQRIGGLLREVEDWWISGDFKADREAALAKLASLAAD